MFFLKSYFLHCSPFSFVANNICYVISRLRVVIFVVDYCLLLIVVIIDVTNLVVTKNSLFNTIICKLLIFLIRF